MNQLVNADLKTKKLVLLAHYHLTIKKGRKQYAPSAHEIQQWIDSYGNK